METGLELLLDATALLLLELPNPLCSPQFAEDHKVTQLAKTLAQFHPKLSQNGQTRNKFTSSSILIRAIWKLTNTWMSLANVQQATNSAETNHPNPRESASASLSKNAQSPRFRSLLRQD